MDRNVPDGAAILLNFIGDIEAPQGYGTLYGNNHGKLTTPLTQMTVDQVIATGPSWSRRFGSSAAGRYQFMNATLKGLKKELGLRGTQVFNPDLQDRLAYHLLKRRGYEAFVDKKIGAVEFAKRLAQEWASLPVLVDTKGAKRDVKRGQSYYAGDGLNKSLVTPDRVEVVLSLVLAGRPAPKPVPPAVTPIPPQPDKSKAIGWGLIIAGIIAFVSAVFAGAYHAVTATFLDLVNWIF